MKTRQTEEEVGRQHQGMDRPGVRQVPEGSGEQGKMEKTGCKIICGAPTTLAIKGLMMMMMMMMMKRKFRKAPLVLAYPCPPPPQPPLPRGSCVEKAFTSACNAEFLNCGNRRKIRDNMTPNQMLTFKELRTLPLTHNAQCLMSFREQVGCHCYYIFRKKTTLSKKIFFFFFARR